jgi:ABC-2 type transport system ATP-binding protein
MIHTEALTKSFDGRVAVENLNLDVKDGEVFGFLGPNGAGKTTTVRLLCSLIGPTSGRAIVNGFEVGKQDMDIRRTVGILTETPGLYDRLSAERNLTIFADLYEVPADQRDQRVRHYLEMMGLWERRDDMVVGYSKGMRQKLAIARSLIHDPKMLFLDEPTASLDPEASKVVHEFIDELRKEGHTIFLCTHNLDEADRLCDRIGVMKQTMIRVDSQANLRRSLYGRKIILQVAAVSPEIIAAIKALAFVKSVEQDGTSLTIALDKPEEQNPALVRAVIDAGASIQFLTEIKYSLEDVYFSLVGQGGMGGQS